MTEKEFRPTWLLESEYKPLIKLEPTPENTWRLLKRRSHGWEWCDSISDDSALRLIESADKSYCSR